MHPQRDAFAIHAQDHHFIAGDVATTGFAKHAQIMISQNRTYGKYRLNMAFD